MFGEKEIAPWPDEKQDIREYCKEHRVWAMKSSGEHKPIGWYRVGEKPTLDIDGKAWLNTFPNFAELLNPAYFIFPDVSWDKSLIAPDGSMPLLEKKPERATHFEVGKWYVNVGKNEGVPMVDQKQAALDRKPHKVITCDADVSRDSGWEFVKFSGVDGGGWNWNPKDWIEVPEPKEKYVPKKDDPIFAWDKGFDKRCPCPVYYVHHVDERGRVWDYMDGKYCKEGIDYDYYRKYDPALVGVPMKDWKAE